MNRIFLTFTFIFSLSLVSCGGKKKNPDPNNILTDTETTAIKIIEQDSAHVQSATQFYELEESIEDIQKQIAQLQTRVMEYEYKPPETNYTEKLKKLIDEPPPAHKITLKNGSVLEGTIEKDLVEDIMLKTDVGKLTIQKKEIEFIQDIILPAPHIVFIGHGREQVFESHHLFTGKIMNHGSRRGDFVRVIYQLWGEDTQLIKSDSAFVAGTQIMYKSGIVTDTVLEPNQSARFNVQIAIDGETPVSYVTREIHWSLYD